MRLYILGSNKLHSINVKDKTEKLVSVSFKYNDKVDLSINLENDGEKWNLLRNDAVTIYSNDEIKNVISIAYYKVYFLNVIKTNNKIAVIPMPSYEEKTYDLSYKELNKFYLGSNKDCHICYKNELTKDVHAIFKIENDNWYIEAHDESIIYVNNNLIKKSILKTGDVIFVNGIRIIWNTNYMRINNPGNMYVKEFKVYKTSDNNQNYNKEEKTQLIELYNKDDYYYPKLLINNKIVKEKINIASPPSSNKKEELPFVLTLGSSITMLGSSFMMTYMVIYNLTNGSKSIAAVIPQIVSCCTMIIGSLLMPKIISRYNKRKNKKDEIIRVRKYTEYLKSKKEQIDEIINNQKQILNENNPSIDECISFLNNGKINNIKFWSRNIKDDVFATIRLGNGNLKSNLDIELPEKEFSINEDDLENKMYEIKNDAMLLRNVPIILDLKSNNKTGIMFKTSHKWEYINGLLLQLTVLHNPSDLKIIVFTNEENKNMFEDYKYLPHLWSDDKQMRFFASNTDEIQKISEFIVNEYKFRKENGKDKIDNSIEVEAEDESYKKEELYKKYQPYYILIDDNYDISKNSSIVNLLNETAVNFGFSYIGLGEELKDFPNNCSTFVEINEKKGNILKNNSTINDVVTFNNEYSLNTNFRKIINQIANVPIKIKNQESALPQSLQFLEMLDVSKIEQLNILNRWKMNSPVTSLSTIVGVHTNGEKFKLDLHEKAHGPHGLIAGMTGSGKSEFIITYILSMIINYHPYEVQFVLIDYKGGGLAGAFENKEKGYKIPHLVGTITNLDTAEMNRTLVSIQSECKKRQIVFNEIKEKLGESTIDIYKYQRLYREGVIKDPMAHLFIICDEFAELKASQPDFMSQLISVARIGRSLGIHLILATQKPTGVVNDQIWSNSKFKVCLKVQDRSDSMEMLKKPDAASIKEIGRFYLQVGYDDYFDIGQSGWSGAKYVPTDYIIKKIDDSLNFVNNIGEQYKTIKKAIQLDNIQNNGDQLTNIVKDICNIAISENIKTNNLWLDPIPENIYIDKLKKKYGYSAQSYYINPVIGEYDDPNNQQQGLLNIDLTNNGNTLIYGQTGSGKEQLLSTIIGSISLEHTPDEVNIYILDFGSGSLQIFNSFPHVGDVANIEQLEKVQDTFSMIYELIEERRKIFVEYSGNYQDYIKSSSNKLPLIVVIINNYEVFVENNNRLSNNISNLYRDASKYGIIFIITSTSSSGVRGRMSQYFTNKLCLQLPDVNDYRTILNSPRGLIPSNYYGRGLINIDDNVYEFQTASIFSRNNFNEKIRQIGKIMNGAYSINAKKIPTVPNVVISSQLENNNISITNIPIGYNIIDKKPISFDASKTPFISIITEQMTNDRMSFVYSFINMLTKIKNTNVKIVDLIGVYKRNKNNLEIFNNNWEKTIIKLYNDIIYSEKNSNNTIYVLLGIGQIQKILSHNSLQLLSKILSTINTNSNSKFVLIDVYGSIKNLGTEIWYQSCVDKSYGIWLGENVGTQLAINISNLSMEDRKINFPNMAFMVINGKHNIIKHMVECEDDIDE